VDQLSNWLPLFISVGVLFSALLVNRFVPKRRRRMKRLLVLLGLYLSAVGVRYALRALDQEAWAGRVDLFAAICEAAAIINLASLLFFDVVLRLVRLDPTTIVSDLVTGVAYIVTTVAILRARGVELTTVLAGSAIVSGILALSLQATLGNILGGVALQLDGSIHVGDWLMLENGKQGRVTEIGWRHTVLETRDWTTMVVPNSSLLASTITILGKRDGGPVPYRMWVYFHVDFRFAPATVIAAVEDALRSSPIERVSPDPQPNCICMDFAKDGRDSYAMYAVRYWLTDSSADDPTSSAVRARIWSALERAQIPFARPARTLFTHDASKYQADRLARHHQQRERALQSVDLFHPLTEEEIHHLAEHLVEVPFSAGERMTRQGATAHWLYLLAQGRAEIRIQMERMTKVVAQIEAPDFFGEMGLMTGEPRQADVVALTDTVCYRLDKTAFEHILRERPAIAGELSAKLAKRRMVLVAVREDLDESTRAARESSEKERILERIKDFFAL